MALWLIIVMIVLIIAIIIIIITNIITTIINIVIISTTEMYGSLGLEHPNVSDCYRPSSEKQSLFPLFSLTGLNGPTGLKLVFTVNIVFSTCCTKEQMT